jgi:hypothetical protein
MSLAISKERKEEIVQSTRRFFAEKLEIDLSEVQAGTFSVFAATPCPYLFLVR